MSGNWFTGVLVGIYFIIICFTFVAGFCTLGLCAFPGSEMPTIATVLMTLTGHKIGSGAAQFL